MKFFKRLLLAVLFVYLLPALASAGWWYVKERPVSWREADWSSAHILPEPQNDRDAAIYIFSATTGGMKGAVASHSWIVTKGKGDTAYNRYDKVGWGSPIRRNGYPADARWYSNTPQLVTSIKGDEAARLIPKIEQAIQSYPYSKPGAYRIWPGPNSNTFVAHVLRSVPELGAVLPPNAVGRDYLPEGKLFAIDADGLDMHATLYGLLGISAGARSGLEVHFMGLVAGFDVARPAIKIPALGRFGVQQTNKKGRTRRPSMSFGQVTGPGRISSKTRPAGRVVQIEGCLVPTITTPMSVTRFEISLDTGSPSFRSVEDDLKVVRFLPIARAAGFRL